MLNLEPDEKILIALHHHWIAILGPVLMITFLVILPWALLPFALSSSRAEIITPLLFFALAVWYLVVLMLGFISGKTEVFPKNSNRTRAPQESISLSNSET